MRYPIDLHIHTNSSPHAFSTFEENVRAALNKNMKVIAITNHGPALADSPHWWSLSNMKILPSYIGDLRILKGVEANIIDDNGNFDINNKIYQVMDLVLCGFHKIDAYGDTMDIIRNTKALLRIIASRTVDIIVHMGNPKFPVLYEEVIKLAKEYDVAIEINNSSLRTARKGSRPNCKKILELCKEYDAIVTLGTDSHISYDIGEFKEAEELIDEVGYPKEKLVNYSMENLNNFLELRKEKRKKRLR